MSDSSPEVVVKATVKRVTFYNPDNGYTVARLVEEETGVTLTAVGKMPGVAEGQELLLKGRKVIHPKFGAQIEVSECKFQNPSNEEGVKKYLASGMVKGVGPVLAERIVSHLGPEAIDIISSDPARLSEVPGVGAAKRKSISESLKSHGDLRRVMVFLQGHGVGVGTAMRIYRRYGSQTLNILEKQPHRLAWEVEGIGFATADAIAARLGIAKNDPARLAAGILFALSSSREQGHVFLPREVLLKEASGLLDIPPKDLEPVLGQAEANRLVSLESDGAAYLPEMLILEKAAASHLARLARGKGILTPDRAQNAVSWVSGRLSFKPSPGQEAALQDLLNHGLGLLTGGPGTGKTTILKALTTIASRMGLTVSLAAPTGRAAKRLSEACGLPASTIHRLLDYSPKENRFAYNRDKPLPADLVVVDESSMLDTWLAAHLFSAVPSSASLVLVGDADQLPSVGPGLVFRQIMESGVAQVARLQGIFRQDEASPIVTAAHAINQGQMPLASSSPADSFFHLESQNAEQGAQTILDLVSRQLPRHHRLDPKWGVQVLSPMHRGPTGCGNLNLLLRGALNPRAKTGALCPGDKVMQMRNNYDLDVYNGDLGEVLKVDDDGCLVEMLERRVLYDQASADDLSLAYAVTIHKSQGSEYPAVVMSLANEHYIMLNRNLLYTAVTRGKKVVGIVGQKKALNRAVRQLDPSRRNARLHQRIRSAAGKGE